MPYNADTGGERVKLTIEIDKEGPEQVIIRTHAVDDRVRRLQEAVDRVLSGGA